MEHNGIENYRGCEIKWEISEIEDTGFWKGTAAIVTPPEASSPPGVKGVPGIPERFRTEKEAYETVLTLAREVIDAVQVGG